MGRQEQPLDPGQGPLARFAHDLRELRRRAGSPPYRELATRAHYSASTLADAASGNRLPSAAVLAAFVGACGGDPQEWEQRRIRTHELITAPRTDLASPPAPSADPAPLSAASATRDGPPRRGRPSRSHGAAPVKRPAALSIAVAVLMALGVAVSGDAGPGQAPVAAQGRSQRGAAPPMSPRPPEDAAWLRTDADIPPRYRSLIVEAGRMCGVPQVTPALVAAILKTESGFDPGLSDPAKDEYGIARWTPRVLRYYLPPDRQRAVPQPPLTPEDSIPALGRMLCAIAPELEGVPGDPALNLAAAYRIATWRVLKQGAELERIRPYLDQVRTAMLDYRPPSSPPSASGGAP
ncbi:helix-turn-helix domain-containing protein [Streptomyces sp. NPDC005409]|uniref:helix-turn-helix domain-containing protein n=1 Tax=Streptomyces sp. NPDC005409 TaxID=3155342 RepID=UPI00345451EC